MPRFNPFPKVNCAYGAPMGRQGDAPGNFVDAPRLSLCARHQGGGEGYDCGGAYWGLPSNVYAVWIRGGEAVTYVRASSEQDSLRIAREG